MIFFLVKIVLKVIRVNLRFLGNKYNFDLINSGNGPELWVLLLEKAYAKVHGCYANIEAGLTGNAIRDLTGAPYEFKSNQEY